jgi:hypothetical protein
MVKRIEHRHQADALLQLVAFQVVQLEAHVAQTEVGGKPFRPTHGLSAVIDADKLRVWQPPRQLACDFAGPAAQIDHGVRRSDGLSGEICEAADREIAGIGRI